MARLHTGAGKEDRHQSSTASTSAGTEEPASTSQSEASRDPAPEREGSSDGGIRTRSGRNLPQLVLFDEGDESDASFAALSSRAASRSSSKKRGRPPTTGEYVGLAEAKRRYVEAHEAEMQVREIEAILDPSVPPRKVSKGAIPLPEEGKIARELRQKPTADVAAIVLEYQDEVEKVASVSKGLKGNLARALRVAALNTRTAIMELTTRSASAATSALETENASLRGQMAELRAEVARLRQTTENRRSSPIPPSELAAAVAMPPANDAGRIP